VRDLFTLLMTFIRFIFSRFACLQDASYYVAVLNRRVKFATCAEKLLACTWINNCPSNGEVLPVHTVKVYRDSSGTTPLVLNLGIR